MQTNIYSSFDLYEQNPADLNPKFNKNLLQRSISILHFLILYFSWQLSTFF